jgi:hypothetical protein
MDILALRAQNLRSPLVHCKFHSVQYSKLSPKSFLPSRKMKNRSPLNSFLPPLFLLPSPTLHHALNSLSLHLITLIHSFITYPNVLDTLSLVGYVTQFKHKFYYPPLI